jgi:hypothetical protein
MTHGFGAMPDYAGQVQPHERWAIAAYIKTLQFSQNAPAAELPADARSQLGAAPPAANAQGRGNAAAPGSNLPPSPRIPVPERPERKNPQ